MDMGSNQNQFLSDQFMALPPLPPVIGSQLHSDQSIALPPLPPVTGSQDWLMSSHVTRIGDINNIGGGGGVIFSQDQQPYTNNPQQQQLQHVSNNFSQDPSVRPNNLQVPPLGQLPASSSADLSMDFSRFLSSELDRQTTEMEAYLHLQNQRLNAVLREETRQRGVQLVKYATNLVSLIQKKENEVALAKQRSMEIEQCILRTDAEVQTWKKLALDKETKVTELSHKLKKVEERIQMLNSGALDADSTCGETSQDKSIMDVYGKCKVCQAQRSCVLLFPCKHLCCCKSCEAIVEFCPICDSLKEENMEIFLA